MEEIQYLDTTVSYKTQGKYYNDTGDSFTWKTVMEGFKTQEEAQLSFANSAIYPLDRSYRIVEVVETVVFK